MTETDRAELGDRVECWLNCPYQTNTYEWRKDWK